MFKIHRLNAHGFAHHAIIMLLVVMTVAGGGAYLVSQSHADNVYTFKKPNGCYPGKTVGPNGGCKLYNQISNITADCTQYHLQFDGSQCVLHCVPGYYISATLGYCVVNNSATDPTPTGGGGGGTSGGTATPTPPTEAECANLNRRNDDKTNNRCEDCYAAYQDGDGNIHTFSDKCVKKAVTTTTTDGGAGSGGGSSGSTANPTPAVVTDNAAQVTCAAQHKKWHTAAKVCGPECVTGYAATAGNTCSISTAAQASAAAAALAASCEKVSTPDGNCVNENRIENYCASRHLKLTDNKKNCKLDCVKGYTLNGMTCIAKSTAESGSSTPNNPSVLNLDTTMDKTTCVNTLGREWENHAVMDDGTFGKGCATNACDKNDPAIVIVLNAADGAPYCKGYLTKNEKATCENKLHRKWVAIAKGCMQNPKDKKAGAREAGAPQCQPKFSTYVWRDAGDECMDPNVVDQLSAIAQATGKPFLGLAHMSQAQLCNIQPHKHWNGNKCVQDKPAQSVNGNGHTEDGGATGADGHGSGETTGASTGSGPFASKTACESSPYNRKWVNGTCSKTCKSSSYYTITKDPYDICVLNGSLGNLPGGNNPTSSGAGQPISCGTQLLSAGEYCPSSAGNCATGYALLGNTSGGHPYKYCKQTSGFTSESAVTVPCSTYRSYFTSSIDYNRFDSGVGAGKPFCYPTDQCAYHKTVGPAKNKYNVYLKTTTACSSI